MGAARQRGSYDERRAMAILRNEKENERLQALYEAQRLERLHAIRKSDARRNSVLPVMRAAAAVMQLPTPNVGNTED